MAATPPPPATKAEEAQYAVGISYRLSVRAKPRTVEDAGAEAPVQPAWTVAASISGPIPELAADLAPHTSGTTTLLDADGRLCQDEWTAAAPPLRLCPTDALVRKLAAASGQLPVTLTLTRVPPAPAAAAPPPAAPPGDKKGGDNKKGSDKKSAATAAAEAAPAAPTISHQCQLSLDASGLLVGDTSCALVWSAGSSKVQVSPEVASILEAVSLKLEVSTPPPPPPVDAAPAAAPKKGAPAASGASSGSGGKKAPADAAKAAAAAAAAAAAQQAPPPTPPPPADPAPLLDASLGAKLAPLVIHLHKVVNLPDAPATQEQLASSSCHPCSMSLAWGGAGATQQPASRLGAWQPAAGGAPGTREARFEAPWVVLLGEAPAGQLLRQLTEVPLVVEVHDRDAVPEQPLFPLPVEEGQAAQASGTGSDGYVCARAAIRLGTLLTSRRLDVHEPLRPHSTIRGAASLTWRQRPGNYGEAGTAVAGVCRLGAPGKELLAAAATAAAAAAAAGGTASATGSRRASAAAAAAPEPAPEPNRVERCVFVFDWRDSQLLHVLEDSMRRHNAVALGLAPAGGGTCYTIEPSIQQAAGAQLAAALQPLEHVGLTARMLQSLSTQQIDAAAAGDACLDLLTGFHVTDGSERLILLEGLAGGRAMQMTSAIVRWAQAETAPAGLAARRVVANREIRFPGRMYAPLGADLYIVKLRAALTALGADVHCLVGSVRPDTVAALRCLLALREGRWMRQAEALPSSQQVHLLDKRYGGPLSVGDVLGAEHEPTAPPPGSCTSMSQQASAAAIGARAAVAAAAAGAGAASTSGRAHGDRRTAALDMDNAAYVAWRQAAQAKRAARDFWQESVDMLATIQADRRGLRDAWATWNPQRAAAKQLEEAVRAGTMTLQEALQLSQPLPEGGSCREAAGATQDGRPPFQWPAPTPPGTFGALHMPLSNQRQAELAEPYDDTPAFAVAATGCGASDGRPSFQSTIKSTDQLFTKDPVYWQTVHLGGDELAQHLEALARAAKEQWQAALRVEDPVMRTHAAPGRTVTQLDKTAGLLKGPPLKPGLAITYVPPAPLNSQVGTPWDPPGAAARKPGPGSGKWTAAESGFRAAVGGGQSAVTKVWAVSAHASQDC